VRPGHIFPLVAREGGVLMRSGHTEAAVDLCKLAGLPPVGVICELVNDDGSVMRGPQVSSFAEKNGLKQVSVADLIAYRQRQESLVERVASFDIETPGGPARAYTYSLPWDPMQHLAVVFGDIRDGVDVPVRLHLENVIVDVFGTAHRLDKLMDDMGRQKRGVIVYLREGSVGVGQQPRRARGADGEDHDEAQRRESEWREVGLGAQILRDLGISSIRLIASRERHYVGLEGFGIEIVRTDIA
jgi:3,4-dihydroxy 2-butanone 4-phosphate synthase/GTP cyclohydrolase II